MEVPITVIKKYAHSQLKKIYQVPETFQQMSKSQKDEGGVMTDEAEQRQLTAHPDGAAEKGSN